MDGLVVVVLALVVAVHSIDDVTFIKVDRRKNGDLIYDSSIVDDVDCKHKYSAKVVSNRTCVCSEEEIFISSEQEKQGSCTKKAEMDCRWEDMEEFGIVNIPLKTSAIIANIYVWNLRTHARHGRWERFPSTIQQYTIIIMHNGYKKVKIMATPQEIVSGQLLKLEFQNGECFMYRGYGMITYPVDLKATFPDFFSESTPSPSPSPTTPSSESPPDLRTFGIVAMIVILIILCLLLIVFVKITRNENRENVGQSDGAV